MRSYTLELLDMARSSYGEDTLPSIVSSSDLCLDLDFINELSVIACSFGTLVRMELTTRSGQVASVEWGPRLAHTPILDYHFCQM